MITQKQLTLADFFEECKDIYESDKPQFLTLLENHIDLDEIVPISFRRHYYASTGRNRKYPLNAMLWALIIQRLLSLNEQKTLHNELLLTILTKLNSPPHLKLTKSLQLFILILIQPKHTCRVCSSRCKKQRTHC